MRIGIISHGSPDYLIDIVTDGMIRLLGRDSLSLDYNHRGGWGGQYIHLFQGFQGPEPFDIHDAEMLIASSRSVDLAKSWIKKTGRGKVAIIDGEDFPMFHDVRPLVKVYFKRELMTSGEIPPNVLPLPFAVIPEKLPAATTDVSNMVFFRGHDTHVFRKEISGILDSMGFPVSKDRIEKQEYNREIMASLIGVSVRGNGWDTYRYWEIPYFGAALLSQRLPIVIPGDFIEGHEAVYYESARDFQTKLTKMLEDQGRTFEIAKAGRKACMERHLSTHRAKTVIEALA